MKARLSILSIVLLGLALSGAGMGIADAATPTPTPTPGPINQPVNSFQVNNSVPLPWPLPILPTYPALTPSPTLFNATAIHSTDYPNAVGTATAQISEFTSPINSLSTPVAALISTGPTPDGSELDTGVDPGTGTISFISWATGLGEDIGPVIGTGIAFANGMIDLGTYSPFIATIFVAELIAAIISAFLALVPTIINAGNWLMNMLLKLFTMIGTWFPG